MQIKVKPGAKANQLLRDSAGKIILKVKAPPVDGKANEEVIRFLSACLRIPKSRISITAGHSSSFKKIEFEGVSAEEVEKKLSAAL